MAGGVSDLGSMRTVKLFHEGKEVATIDMYDYIRNGKVQDDIRLNDNDVVIVSPHSLLVNIDGRIRRPMYYEMKENETLVNLIDYAGGLESDAYRKDVRVIRMGDFQRQIFTVDKDAQSSFRLMDGDSVYVDSIQTTFANMAEVRGAVYRPGQFQIDGGITTVNQLIQAAGGLKEDAFPTRALLSRTNPDKTLTNLSIDIKGLMEGSAQDEPLRNNDVLFIPSLFDIGEVKTFSVYGEVLFPGDYRYADNTSIEDLILQAGGLKEDASLAKVDVVRRNRDKNATEKSENISETFSFSINEDLSIQDNDFRLQPYDEVYVRRSPNYVEQQNVKIEGEVHFAGIYTLSSKGQHLSDIISQAGGLTERAYAKGTKLLRQMTQDERDMLEIMLRTAQRNSGNDSIDVRKLMTNTSYPVGIELDKALKNPGSDDDPILREGDRIVVPHFDGSVKINGEVLYPNTVYYKEGKKTKYYINQAGGVTSTGKKSKAIIIYMNGMVAKADRKHKPMPGCQIVVPTKSRHGSLSVPEILSIGSSTASIAAMIATIVNLSK